MLEYYIAWWNVENLFDIENSIGRLPKLNKILKNELKGWNVNILNQKLLQLAKIIKKLNNNKGPDLLGVCEIENATVMNKLLDKIKITGRNYKIAHHDCKDERGIDVAFLYDSNKLIAQQDFSHEILKRNATRDIYQVNFKTKIKKNDLVVIGNHWPSRSGGVYKTEPYRILAAETLAYFHFRIKEVMKKNANILIMGDFNDDPFDRSLYEYALSSRNKQKVLRAKMPIRLYNLMWPLMDKGLGTYYFENFPFIFDQFLVSKNFLKDNKPFSIKDGSVEIIQFQEMLTGAYNKPRLHSRPRKKNFDSNGFSDHFPIGMVIIEK